MKRKVALVGNGFISKIYLKALEQLRQAKVVGLVETDPKSKSDKFPIYRTMKELKNAHPEVSAVCILTPPDTHPDLVQEAFDCGLDVLVEKPPALSSTECEKLIRIFGSSDQLLYFAWHATHVAGMELLREKLRNQKLVSFEIVWQEDVTRSRESVEMDYEPGSLFDTGINPLAIITQLFGLQYLKVESAILKLDHRHKVDVGGTVKFNGGVLEQDWLHPETVRSVKLITNQHEYKIDIHAGIMEEGGVEIAKEDKESTLVGEYFRQCKDWLEHLEARKSNTHYDPIIVAEEILKAARRRIQSRRESSERRKIAKNPVIPFDFPDPCILPIKKEDGNYEYYAYATGKVDGDNIQMAYSADLANWEVLPGALVEYAKETEVRKEFWGPHVGVVGEGRQKEYRMYYAAKVGDSDNMGIWVAKSDEPTGFKGDFEPIITGSGIDEIDPCSFLDPISGKNYLFWGSGHRPIRARELDAEGVRFAPGSQTHIIATPNDGEQYHTLYEGAEVFYHKDLKKYFLFLSSDGTWNLYGVVVYESSRVLGPYERVNHGQPILAENEDFLLPGQNCVFEVNGEFYTAYHAVFQDDPFIPGVEEKPEFYTAYHSILKPDPSVAGMKHLKRVALIERLSFEGGIPVIRGFEPHHSVPIN